MGSSIVLDSPLRSKIEMSYSEASGHSSGIPTATSPYRQSYSQIPIYPPSSYSGNDRISVVVGDAGVPDIPKLGRSATIKATAGKFVLTIPIAKELLEKAQYTQGEEFTHTSYTAVTCDPEDFNEKYSLRQQRFNRRIKVALVITMYNEDDMLFVKSLLAVQKNIAYLCSHHCPYSWGKDGWKEFVVVIVSDGATKINARVKSILGLYGMWISDQFTRTSVNDAPVTAHLFELTTQIAVDRDFEIRNASDGIVPTQLIFILKQKNAKKINSHKWFFEAVCEVIKPEVVMLLDVGTKPLDKALYHLYRAFERNPFIGGACGEICAEKGPYWKNLLNPLVATQNFEYKMSNILDKPLESVMGYISVLPGAFSAYRYSALQGRPLQQYFKGERPAEKDGKVDLFTSNLYLAEDRILCFELVSKKHCNWILKYVKSARAETDVPDLLPELISQRRRWLNGSFFAALHSLINYPQIFGTSHTAMQKFLFTLEFVYNGLNLLFSWFNLANFYLAFYFLFDSIAKADAAGSGRELDPFFPHGDLVFQVTREIYIFAIVTLVISSMGNRPQGSKWLYYTISVIFSLMMVLMLFLGAWQIRIAALDYTKAVNTGRVSFMSYLTSTPTFRDLVISTLSTYGIYVLSSLVHM